MIRMRALTVVAVAVTLALLAAGTVQAATTPMGQLNAYVWTHYPGLRSAVNWRGGLLNELGSGGGCCLAAHAGIALVGGRIAIVGGAQRVVGLDAEVFTNLAYTPASRSRALAVCNAVATAIAHFRYTNIATLSVFARRPRRESFVDAPSLRLARYPC